MGEFVVEGSVGGNSSLLVGVVLSGCGAMWRKPIMIRREY